MSDYILIVHPDKSHCDVYASLATDLGFDSQIARDGLRARLVLQNKGPPVLIILELALPKLDGFALLKELRAHPETANVPAVVVCAFLALRDVAVRNRKEYGINALLAASSPITSVHRAVSGALAGLHLPHHETAPDAGHPIPASSAVVEGYAPEMPLEVDVSMQAAADRETHRLAELVSMHLVDDQPPDEALQRLVHDTAEAFHVPVALVSLVLEDRQWFKAYIGLQGKLLQDRGTPRSWAFCHHVVEGNQPLIVPDARTHPYFADNPLVKDGSVRSYAGVPLTAPSGHVLGSLCIVDSKPLTIGADGIDSLILIARRVAGELELRSAAHAKPDRRARKKRAVQEALLAEESLPGEASAPDQDTVITLSGSTKTGEPVPIGADLSAVLAEIEEGVLLLDSNRRVILSNAALSEMVGIPSTELIGLTREEWVARLESLSDDPQSVRRKLQVLPEGPYVVHEELALQRPQRRFVRWVCRPVHLPQGAGQLLLYSDITRVHDVLAQQQQLALTDHLTSLPNRRAGEEMLRREVARARRQGAPLGLVIADVDHFKKVNDTRGHAVGDAVLCTVGATLRRMGRDSDLVCRWGGEEFLAVLPGTGLAGARLVAERARASLEAQNTDGMPRVTASFGVALLERGDDASLLTERADAKLREAKTTGRNRVC